MNALTDLQNALTTFAGAVGKTSDRDLIQLRRDAAELEGKLHTALVARERQAVHQSLVDRLRELTKGLKEMAVADLVAATGAARDDVAAAMSTLGYEERTRAWQRVFSQRA